MGNESVRTGGGELDLGGVGRALWTRKAWIAAAALTCMLGSTAFVTLVKPRFTAEAKVLVEAEENFLNRTPPADRPQVDTESMGNHTAVVTSRDLARQAIRKLNLKGNPEFDPRAGAGGFFSDLMGAAGGSSSDEAAEDRIFEYYFNNLNVFSPVRSRVLSIEFSARDPDLAARGANVIADLYLEMQSNAQRQNARAAAQALAQLVTSLRQKLAVAEEQAEKFRSSSGLLSGGSVATLQGQQLTEVNSQVAAGRAAQAEAQAKARLLRDALRSGRINEVPDVAKDELIRRVSEQRITLRSQLALESRTLGPEHPRTKDITAQLAMLDSELRGLVEKTVRTLENDSRIAGARVENLLNAVEQQKKIVGGAGADEVRLRELEREARLLKEQLEVTTARWQDATAREEASATPGEARVISRAVAPQKAAFPKKGPIIALSTLAGLIFSTFAAVSIELFSVNGGPPDRTPTPVNVGPRRSGSRLNGDPGRGGGGLAPARFGASSRVAQARFSEQEDDEYEPEVPARRFAQVRTAAAHEAPAPAPAPAPVAASPQAQSAVSNLSEAQMLALRALAQQVLTLEARQQAQAAAPLESAAPVEQAPPAPAATVHAAPAVAPSPAPAPVMDAPEEPMVVARPPRTAEPQVSAAYRDLAQQMNEQSEPGCAALVLVSGLGGAALAGEAALPLARALAGSSRTILVDFTGHASPLNRRAGLSDLILGLGSFAQAIHRDPGSRLHLLGRGRAEVDLSEGLETVIEALSQTYDFVVFVAPGEEDFDLTMWLAPSVDYSFMACRGNASSAQAIEWRQALEDAGAPDVSVLDLNAMRGGSRPRGGPAQNAA